MSECASYVKRTQNKWRSKEICHGKSFVHTVEKCDSQVFAKSGDTISWVEASRATTVMFAAQESLKTGERIDLRDFAAALWAE